MVEKVKTYTARCQHSGDWWAISVPELKANRRFLRFIGNAGS